MNSDEWGDDGTGRIARCRFAFSPWSIHQDPIVAKRERGERCRIRQSEIPTQKFVRSRALPVRK
jgi:hypothetical protein